MFPEPVHVPDHSTFDPATTAPSEEQNGAEVCDPSDNEEGSVIEEEVVNEPQAHQSQNETSAVDCSDPSAAQDEKKSYASIVSISSSLSPLLQLFFFSFLIFFFLLNCGNVTILIIFASNLI